MDPEARQRQIFDVVRRVDPGARPARDERSTLLEDLHWFDAGSEAFLEPLVEAVAGTRAPGDAELPSRVPRRLDAASRTTSSCRVAAARTRRDPRAARATCSATTRASRGLAEAIHARTAGNPFFTEEVVQSLIESGSSSGQPGGSYRSGDADRQARRCRPRCRRCWRARIDRLAGAREAGAADGGGDRQEVRRSRSSRPSSTRRSSPMASCADALHTLKAPSSSTSRRSTRWPSTSSSTR